MKILELKDSSTIEFSEESTLSMLLKVVPSFNDIESIRTLLTPENLSECTFDGVEYKNLSLGSATASAQDADVSLIIGLKTAQEQELERLEAQVEQLETENAALVAENENLTDKATAADILLGNVEV